VRELRIPIVVLVIDLFTTLGQVVLQIPEIRRLPPQFANFDIDAIGHGRALERL